MPKPTAFRSSTVRSASASTISPKNIWLRQRSRRACFWSWSLERRHRCGISAPGTTSKERTHAPGLRRGRLYVNHYSFHIVDPDWGHLTIKISGHPPFPAQVILNGHEYVACQARKAGITFTKEGNCYTSISDAAGLAKI